MQGHAPSATALRVAALRALHQTQDVPPIFLDPLAERVLGPDAAELLSYYRERADETARLRGTLAARAVIAEETIAAAVARGVEQCVILGAGLDTFAYRQGSREHGRPALAVFEVDQAATQGWKRELLAAADIEVPANVAFIPLHFERGDLFEALADHGFEGTRPGVFAMLGVTPYVEREVLLETFRRIAAQSAPGTEIVFDYTEPFAKSSAEIRAIYEAVATRVAAGGEPWVTFFEPDPLHRALRERGFAEITDLDSGALQQRFCAGRTDGLTVAPLVHLIRART